MPRRENNGVTLFTILWVVAKTAKANKLFWLLWRVVFHFCDIPLTPVMTIMVVA